MKMTVRLSAEGDAKCHRAQGAALPTTNPGNATASRLAADVHADGGTFAQ